MGWYLTKYWFYEDGTFSITCNGLSSTRSYKICRMNVFQSLAYRKEHFVLRKIAVFQKLSKFPHFHIFSRNFFFVEMYLGVSFIIPYNNRST